MKSIIKKILTEAKKSNRITILWNEEDYKLYSLVKPYLESIIDVYFDPNKKITYLAEKDTDRIILDSFKIKQQLREMFDISATQASEFFQLFELEAKKIRKPLFPNRIDENEEKSVGLIYDVLSNIGYKDNVFGNPKYCFHHDIITSCYTAKAHNTYDYKGLQRYFLIGLLVQYFQEEYGFHDREIYKGLERFFNIDLSFFYED